MSCVVAVAGVIPGAGATTVVGTLGGALAEQRHHVALVDASPEGSRLGDVLAVADGDRLPDALRRRADLADVQYDGPHGTRVFPAAPDTNWTSIRPGAVESTYDDLRERFEVALVDCGSAVTPAAAAWLGYADELVVVTDPDVVDDVPRLVAVGEAFDVTLRGIVANRVVRDDAASAGQRLDATGETVLAVLPEDPTVDAAASAERTVFEHEPDSPIANCVWELADRFAARDHSSPVVPPGWIDGGSSGGATGSGSGGAEAGDEHGDADATTTADGGSPGAAGSGASNAGGASTGAAGAGSSSSGSAGSSAEPAGTTADSGRATAGSGGSTSGAADASSSSSSSSPSSSSSSSPSSSSSSSSSSSPSSSPSRKRTGSRESSRSSSSESPSSASRSSASGTESSSTGSKPESGGSGSSSGRTKSSSPSTSSGGSGSAGRSASAASGSRTTSATSSAASSTSRSSSSGTADAGGTREASDDELDLTIPDPSAESDSGEFDLGGARDRSSGGGSGDEISDEEIEEVFKETMERVREQRDRDEADD